MRLKNIRLTKSTDLLISLEELSKKEKLEGYVLSIVGDLSTATFKCPNHEEIKKLSGHFEIISLGGTISPHNTHLHLSVSDDKCQLFGGHLEKGSLVLKAVDILVGFLDLDNEHQNSQLPISLINRVEVYILEGCPWSKRAVRLLKMLDIPHNIITLKDDDEFEKLNKRSHSTTFPQIFIDGSFVGGYDELVRLSNEGHLSNLK
ncbi:PCC domain-containing protein [Prochlorococcus sp. MIT 1223]|uniref:PCC domain-containing protein n=1 Tax=Prochlorococcus sp. MIT 1223 TaxID=3096217 RepID=UPI002A75114A|nr:DUF296 domain-containing protein [Prochlorococcus sp. MIT 1223]